MPKSQLQSSEISEGSRFISVLLCRRLPYLLLARIAEECSNSQQARAWLRKAIYLAPTCVVAYLEFGALCFRQSNAARARQMRFAAQESLKMIPRDSAVEGLEPCRAGELKGAIRVLPRVLLATS